MKKRVTRLNEETGKLEAVQVDMTEEEIAYRQQEEQEHLDNVDMNAWVAEMQHSDALMSREVEEILDKIGTEGMPQELKDKYDGKKTKRAGKPA